MTRDARVFAREVWDGSAKPLLRKVVPFEQPARLRHPREGPARARITADETMSTTVRGAPFRVVRRHPNFILVSPMT
ncbi:hypothetical protein C7441_109126 [Pseudaminobacter salicylatoxidans]|uniref:Uncharacterized protein n=1 Tax=Pseudaminobacter salicylatoxidans TaxID=93369 RepID=A0A316C1B9_PSESE|nr:hypothetical protein C7441_109126 [Pseudaminobacter salicylatoxidans]